MTGRDKSGLAAFGDPVHWIFGKAVLEVRKVSTGLAIVVRSCHGQLCVGWTITL